MPLELTESPDECADGTCRLPCDPTRRLASHRPGVFSLSHIGCCEEVIAHAGPQVLLLLRVDGRGGCKQ
jgi:hypothetical protein